MAENSEYWRGYRAAAEEMSRRIQGGTAVVNAQVELVERAQRGGEIDMPVVVNPGISGYATPALGASPSGQTVVPGSEGVPAVSGATAGTGDANVTQPGQPGHPTAPTRPPGQANP